MITRNQPSLIVDRENRLSFKFAMKFKYKILINYWLIFLL